MMDPVQTSLEKTGSRPPVLSESTQGDQLKDTALEATNRLKQALMNEREAKLRLQDDVERLKEHMKELNRQLGVVKDSEESYKRSLRSMEEVTAKMERDGIQQQTHEASKIVLPVTLWHNFFVIFASREELKNRYSLDSKELKEVLDEHAQKKDREYRLEMKAQQERIETLTKQYTELEDEFRMALQIEANRFRELEVAYEKLVDENKQSKQSLLAAHGKDEETTSIVTELTALVKEQKGRISELSKSKSEQSLEYRERIQTLEAHVEEAKKRMLQMELLKQDKTKLLAQVEAQESVISGLKAERKLWGQELAQQGASLAQDRGRLESKIEAQTSEITTLKKNFEALVDRDEEIKKAREESLKIQKNLEEQLNEERANIQDNQETIEHLRERKQELKQQLSDITAELDDSKKAHGILNNKWKEKSHLIGQLETQVQEMKENWEGKERKLTEERNKAVEAANIAIEKLRNIDDAFRSQLETKEQKHQEEMGMLERDKQLEVDQANRRVYEVEEEMRELLKENEANKRTMEDKVKRLTQAMADIQSDLL
ncbi:hypothetical protein FSP39_020173 [Pinctada imbricata]|uniref:Uncharacterized protein n=1 Tax=Pinctada imbricata TaxID=66713 RepID=A0AA88XJV4_PINIB|nr:hypothetical protein FSP39_020173 [Pinctada imbricata]